MKVRTTVLCECCAETAAIMADGNPVKDNWLAMRIANEELRVSPLSKSSMDKDAMHCTYAVCGVGCGVRIFQKWVNGELKGQN